MDELEAVNMMLRAIGSSPVTNLDSGHPDSDNALTTLQRKAKQTQRRGWWFNIDYRVTYVPDSDGFINIPSSISTLILEDNKYIQRGDTVYNKVDQTYKFDSSVVASRQVRILDWDDLPDCAQEYIAYDAAAEFIRDEIEDSNKESSFRQSAGIAALNMKKQDLEEGQYNMYSTGRVRRARMGVRPYRLG